MSKEEMNRIIDRRQVSISRMEISSVKHSIGKKTMGAGQNPHRIVCVLP